MSKLTFTERRETYPEYRDKMRGMGIVPNNISLGDARGLFKQAWNGWRYQEQKKLISARLLSKQNTTDDYLQYYADCVVNQDYEAAHAVNEVLRDQGVDPTVTHKFILPQ